MKRKMTSIVLAILAVAAFTVFGFWLTHVKNAPPLKSDAIAVMAGGYRERVSAAARLFHDGYGKLIILANDGDRAGWSQRHERNLYKVERAEEELVRLGVPRECIVKLSYNGNSTMFDALAIKRYVLENNIRSLLIVTSDYHLRRSVWICRRLLRNHPVTLSSCPAQSLNTRFLDYVAEYAKLVFYVVRWR